MAGAYDDAVMVTRALQARASAPQAIGREACRQALDQLGESLAMRESIALIGDLDDDNWNAIKAVIDTIGVSSVEALKSVVAVEKDDLTTARAEAVIVGFGQRAVTRLASLVSDPRWFVQRRAATGQGAQVSIEQREPAPVTLTRTKRHLAAGGPTSSGRK